MFGRDRRKIVCCGRSSRRTLLLAAYSAGRTVELSRETEAEESAVWSVTEKGKIYADNIPFMGCCYGFPVNFDGFDGRFSDYGLFRTSFVGFIEMAMKTAIIPFLCFLSYTQIAMSVVAADAAKPTCTLQSERKAGQTDRVTVLVEVGGDFKEGAQGKDERTRMSGTANLTYHEMTLATDPNRLRAVRYYEKAQSVAKFKDGSHRPSLTDGRRLIGVAIDPPTVNMFSLGEPLTRDELEVIDLLGDSLLLDRLLPEGPVAIGDTWKPADSVAAALLGLDNVTRNELQCVLKEVTHKVARVEMSGSVEGPVNDTKTRIGMKGKYRFDLKTDRIDWFAMLTKEERGVSRVAVGFDVTVRFQMTIAPEDAPPELAKEKIAGLKVEPTSDLSQLRYESPRGRWQITYDRQWFLNSDDQEDAVLKLIREGAVLGQCNIASLPQRERGHLVSLEEFQEDVKKALGKSFGQFVEAKQSADPAGHRVLRVVVNGVVHEKATEVPICWIYYHLADEEGRQTAFTFTVEQELLERFAGADRAIVGSLRFAKPSNPKASQSLTAEGDASRR